MPRVNHKEVEEELYEEALISEVVDASEDIDLWEKDQDDYRVIMGERNLPEGVTIQHEYLEYMKNRKSN